MRSQLSGTPQPTNSLAGGGGGGAGSVIHSNTVHGCGVSVVTGHGSSSTTGMAYAGVPAIGTQSSKPMPGTLAWLSAYPNALPM